MIGTIGFFIGALTIAFFAVTAYRSYRVVDLASLRLFVTAFILFALAMVLWGIAAASPSSENLLPYIFAGDTLLTFATACMAFILLGGIRIITGVIVAFIVALLLANRMSVYLPRSYVRDGLLYFNLTGGVRTVFLLAFVLIWLPAMLLVADRLSRDSALRGLGRALTSFYTLLVLVSALFICARRPITIISEFFLIAALFLTLGIVNILIISVHTKMAALEVAGEKKHATKHARKQRSK